MILAIVWGCVVFVGQSVLQGVSARGTIASVQQFNTVHADAVRSSQAMVRANTSLNTCTTLSCVQSADRHAADVLAQFGHELRTASVPAGAADSVQQVQSDVTQLTEAFRRLAAVVGGAVP